MIRKVFLFYFTLISYCGISQISPTDVEFEAKPIGIHDQLENILETQLTLPKYFISTFDLEHKVIVFLNVDSLGNACNLHFDTGLNNLIRIELTRMFRFLKFKRTLSLHEEASPYFVMFPISTKKYLKYKKQKLKPIVKSNLPADSSYVIHSKSDKSPYYYKNGEDGFRDYLLSELSYPKAALEKSLEGTVLLDFVVETNGFVTNIEVKKGLALGCTEEAVRLTKSSRWQPAELNGKLIRYKISYPFTFSIVNTIHSGTNSNPALGQ